MANVSFFTVLFLVLTACGDDSGVSADGAVGADAAGDGGMMLRDGGSSDGGVPESDGSALDGGASDVGARDGGPDAGPPGRFATLEELFSGTEIVALARDDAPGGYLSFDLTLAQPVDRAAPAATYEQLAVLLVPSDSSNDTTLTLDCSGYADLASVPSEVTLLHGGAQLSVSYRYNHEPIPPPNDPTYEFLTPESGAADLQVWLDLVRGYFSGSVISTGISRGGAVALTHRMFFPGQVDGSVVYVVPDIDGAPDDRYVEALQTIGTPACQSTLETLQRALLSTRRAEMVDNLERTLMPAPSFDRVGGPESALEAIVVNLTLGFWQWQSADLRCGTIPAPDANLNDLFGFLFNTRMLQLATDDLQEFFTPYYILAGRAEGYPGLPTDHLSDLLMTDPPSLEAGTFPAGVTVAFDPAFDRSFDAFVADQVEHVVQITGEVDAWAAFTHAEAPARDHRSFEAAATGHRARMVDLRSADRDAAEAMIRAWID